MTPTLKIASEGGTSTPATSHGKFVGIANRTNSIDRAGDLILKGAFQSCLPQFLERGFIAYSHLWDSLPVGYPLAANDGKEGLKVLAAFHSDQLSQSVRQMIQLRMAQGLICGLSIGFLADPKWIRTFANGKELARYLQKEKLGAAINIAEVSNFPDPCRLITKVSELLETSFAMVPINSDSFVTFIE